MKRGNVLQSLVTVDFMHHLHGKQLERRLGGVRKRQQAYRAVEPHGKQSMQKERIATTVNEVGGKVFDRAVARFSYC